MRESRVMGGPTLLPCRVSEIFIEARNDLAATQVFKDAVESGTGGRDQLRRVDRIRNALARSTQISGDTVEGRDRDRSVLFFTDLSRRSLTPTVCAISSWSDPFSRRSRSSFIKLPLGVTLFIVTSAFLLSAGYKGRSAFDRPEAAHERHRLQALRRPGHKICTFRHDRWVTIMTSVCCDQPPGTN